MDGKGADLGCIESGNEGGAMKLVKKIGGAVHAFLCGLLYGSNRSYLLAGVEWNLEDEAPSETHPNKIKGLVDPPGIVLPLD